MGGGGGGDTTTIQDVPPAFRPAFLSLFNSAMGASRTAAGQPGFPETFRFTPGFDRFQPQTGLGGSSLQGFGGTAGRPLGSLGSFDFGASPFTTSQAAPSSGQEAGRRGGGGSRQPSQTQQPAPGPFGSTQGSEGVPLSGGPPIIGPQFPGPFNAAPTPQDIASLQLRQGVAGQAFGAGDELLGLGRATAGGAFLNPLTNPALQGAIQSAILPSFQAFNKARGDIASQGIAAGAFKGSSRRGLQEQALASDFERNVGDIAASLTFQNLMNERQLQQNAGQLIDESIRLQQLSPEILGQVGTGLRQLEQLAIEERLRQFEESIEAPFRPLLPLASIIQGQNIGNITTRAQETARGGFGGGIVGGLGGAAGGAALGGAAGLEGGQLAGATGLGGALGAILGGLA